MTLAQAIHQRTRIGHRDADDRRALAPGPRGVDFKARGFEALDQQRGQVTHPRLDGGQTDGLQEGGAAAQDMQAEEIRIAALEMVRRPSSNPASGISSASRVTACLRPQDSRDITTTLNAAINKGLNGPDVRERFTAMTFDISTGSPQDFRRLLVPEDLRWKGVQKQVNIRLD